MSAGSASPGRPEVDPATPRTPTIPVQIKILDPRVAARGEFGLPSAGTPLAAAFDLSACAFYSPDADGKPDPQSRQVLESGDVVKIAPGRTAFIGHGFCMGVDQPGWVGLLLPRSGKGAQGLVMGNGTGVYDLSEYRGEVRSVLMNRNLTRTISVTAGDRVAQMTIVPCVLPGWMPVEEFAATGRGENGFGSTG